MPPASQLVRASTQAEVWPPDREECDGQREAHDERNCFLVVHRSSPSRIRRPNSLPIHLRKLSKALSGCGTSTPIILAHITLGLWSIESTVICTSSSSKTTLPAGRGFCSTL